MKRTLLFALALLAALTLFQTSAEARKLKVYSLPKQLAPGEVGILVFENPDPDQVKAQSKCGAERLIGWVKTDVPILRIEQNGKQMWMGLESYRTQGDSIIATFMAPLMLEPGRATLFVDNNHDPSIPRYFDVVSKIEPKLTGIQGTGISPLAQFRLLGTGFVAVELLDTNKVKPELEANMGYSKLTKREQWKVMNHRMETEWYKVAQGDFLTVEQNGKKCPLFVEQCSFTTNGLALDFIAPPDLAPGTATLTLDVRVNGKSVGTSAPMTVNVVQ